MAQPPTQKFQRATRTVLVTGSPGVIARTLLSRLASAQTEDRLVGVTAGRYPPGPNSGDNNLLSRNRSEYDPAVETIDAVVHISATSALLPNAGYSAQCAREAVSFAERAQVPIYYVGSAYTTSRGMASDANSFGNRADPETVAEQAIRGSSAPTVIIRPSVVIGDSRTGVISEFTGVYQFIQLLLRTGLDQLPADPDWLIDLIPIDVVVDVIVKLVQNDITAGEFWLTNGESAMTVEQFWDTLGNYAGPDHFAVGDLRYEPASPAGAHRGANVAALPRAERRKLTMLMDLFARNVLQDRPLESSLGDRFETSIGELGALGVTAVPDQRRALSASLRHWGNAGDVLARRGLVA